MKLTHAVFQSITHFRPHGKMAAAVSSNSVVREEKKCLDHVCGVPTTQRCLPPHDCQLDQDTGCLKSGIMVRRSKLQTQIMNCGGLVYIWGDTSDAKACSGDRTYRYRDNVGINFV